MAVYIHSTASNKFSKNQILLVKPFVIIFLLLFSFSWIAVAQTEKIDSLRKVLLTAKDTTRINCLNALSKEYVDVNSDTALLFADAALSEAKVILFTHGMADAFLNKGKIEWNKSNLSGAHNYFINAIDLYKKTNDIDLLGSAYENLAQIVSTIGNYSLSI